MTHDVIYARNDLTIEDIYYLIKEKKVSQIPITGFGKKIIGIVNKKIILSLLMNHLDDTQAILKEKLMMFICQKF